MGFGAQHRVPQPLGLALAHEVDVGEVGGGLHALETRGVALVEQLGLELGDRVEMVRQRVLVATDDHQDVADAGGDRLLDDILDRGLVDDREHLLRCRLGRGEETRSQAGGGDDCLDLRGMHSPMLVEPPFAPGKLDIPRDHPLPPPRLAP